MEPAGGRACIEPMDVAVSQYPQLRQLCWNRAEDAVLEGADALSLHERNRHLADEASLGPDERALIDHLVRRYGNGAFMPA